MCNNITHTFYKSHTNTPLSELELDKKTYNPPSEEELAMLALYAEQRQAGADLRTERGPEQRAAEYSAATTSSQDMYNQRYSLHLSEHLLLMILF